MKQWYSVTYRDRNGKTCSMMCKGEFRAEALRDASERLGDGEEILGAISAEPVYPREYNNQTIEGTPRRAFR